MVYVVDDDLDNKVELIVGDGLEHFLDHVIAVLIFDALLHTVSQLVNDFLLHVVVALELLIRQDKQKALQSHTSKAFWMTLHP